MSLLKGVDVIVFEPTSAYQNTAKREGLDELSGYGDAVAAMEKTQLISIILGKTDTASRYRPSCGLDFLHGK